MTECLSYGKRIDCHDSATAESRNDKLESVTYRNDGNGIITHNDSCGI
ncbi:hypothetical protein [Helicobacter sp. T3_23-1056]